ncbi:MAG: TIGR00153 family protein [Planctomycetes bacterium]|nr:TIGR00153 family protein [Planctomycetota bacterium]
MRSILSLFQQSPFGPIQKHMQVVVSCVEALRALVDDVVNNDSANLAVMETKVSELEHEADVVKTKIRDTLPNSLFLPVDRRDLLEVVSSIDSIADAAQDVARLLAMRKMKFPAPLKESFTEFCGYVWRSADDAGRVVHELDQLLQSAFAGSQAEKVLTLISELGKEEHGADIAQGKLLMDLFRLEDGMKTLDVFWWLKTFGKLSDVSNNSEGMANSLRLFMAK